MVDLLNVELHLIPIGRIETGNSPVGFNGILKSLFEGIQTTEVILGGQLPSVVGSIHVLIGAHDVPGRLVLRHLR